MNRYQNTIYYLGIATLFTHEMDAMPNHEWRVMPLLRSLPDDLGMLIFVLGHIPLFALIMAFSATPNLALRRIARRIIAGFLIIHAGLHLYFTSHPAYTFHDGLSHFLIFGGAVLGFVYLVIDRVNPGTNEKYST